MDEATLAFPWTTLLAALTALFTGVGAATVIFAARQLKLSAWLKLQEIWTADDFVEDRDWVLNHTGPWSPEEKKRAKDVCRRLDEFAHLVPYLGLTSRRGTTQALRYWADPFGRCWRALEDVVREEQRQVAWYRKWKGFEDLGELAAKAAAKQLSSSDVEAARHRLNSRGH